MYIKTLELENFRNYKNLHIDFDRGTTILYGDNAQGKTNVLEAIFYLAITKSYKGVKDKDVIFFGEEEAHLKAFLEKKEEPVRIDMHLRTGKAKGIALNLEKVKKAVDLLGTMNVVLFSPEDLNIIKEGPANRRQFVDMELCQLDSFYTYNLTNYNKIINQRNTLLKDIYFNPTLKETLNIWDNQMISYGSKIIERRNGFISQLNEIIYDIHKKLSGGTEEIKIIYDPNTSIEDYESNLMKSKDRDLKSKITSTGPHRDDFIFEVNGVDIRKFGSQGQQRTAALSLKLAEIELIKNVTKDVPILLLDDVLSELDSNRQKFLLDTIGNVQTIITCTGLDEFVNDRFEINKVYKVKNGTVEEMSKQD
ncbi:MAG: DNA replication/repair protein RecF [Lachnospiraceae bacterium]|nr:DNA replication/repair protein RecF [Lachnospiraceae bacterium]